VRECDAVSDGGSLCGVLSLSFSQPHCCVVNPQQAQHTQPACKHSCDGCQPHAGPRRLVPRRTVQGSAPLRGERPLSGESLCQSGVMRYTQMLSIQAVHTYTCSRAEIQFLYTCESDGKYTAPVIAVFRCGAANHTRPTERVYVGVNPTTQRDNNTCMGRGLPLPKRSCGHNHAKVELSR
jgi:hypothetical protein